MTAHEGTKVLERGMDIDILFSGMKGISRRVVRRTLLGSRIIIAVGNNVPTYGAVLR